MATYQGHNEDSSGNILLPLANGMVAKVETGTTASQAYTKGTYFSANNRFCKAKTAIASGDTLTSGTNYTATSVGAEMKSHLQLSDGSKEFYFDYQNSKYGWNEKADRSGTFHPFGGTGIFDAKYVAYCIIYAYNNVNNLTTFNGISGTPKKFSLIVCRGVGNANSIIVDYDNGTYTYKKVTQSDSYVAETSYTTTGGAITSGTNPNFTITISSGKITVKAPVLGYNLSGFLYVWE